MQEYPIPRRTAASPRRFDPRFCTPVPPCCFQESPGYYSGFPISSLRGVDSSLPDFLTHKPVHFPGPAQKKFSTLFVSPLPLYLALCGYGHSSRVIIAAPSA